MAEDLSETIAIPPYHEFTTARLRLRTLRVSDAEAVCPMLKQSNVMQWTSTGFPVRNLSQAQRWVKDRALGQSVFNFLIQLRESGKGERSPQMDIAVGVMGSFNPPSVGYLINEGTGSYFWHLLAVW